MPSARRPHKFPRFTAVAAVAGLLALAACDQGPSTVTPFMHPSGSFNFLVSATRQDGPLYMEIDGEAFAHDDGLEDRVGAVIERAVQTRILRLTTDQGAAEDPHFRLVLVLNPPDKGELLAFCEEQPAGGPANPESRIDLRAGFCRGDSLIAAVDGWVEEVEGPGDPRVEQLLRQVARDLFSRAPKDS
jgi:hypothetical protein